MHEQVCLVTEKSFLASKYSFFLATLNCAAAVAALNHRLCIWHFEVSCPKLLGLKRIRTIWRHDAIDIFKIKYALAKNQYGLGCIGCSNCYGPVYIFIATCTCKWFLCANL